MCQYRNLKTYRFQIEFVDDFTKSSSQNQHNKIKQSTQNPKMKNNRRNFISKLSLGIATIPALSLASCAQETPVETAPKKALPVIITTWDAGIVANEAALANLKSGGTSLDAVEAGVMPAEADAANQYVGIGGKPDRDGYVTLDACIMDWEGNAGSVCFVQDILHPISVARRVMEKTPHVMLVGTGARQFAIEEGFETTDLLTEQSKKDWDEWRKTSEYKPVINTENHDTIGMLAIDEKGNISGACTTSGMAFKMHGRVGDSPIIGAGLFVDNEVGGAVATGLGEAVLRTLTSFLTVEFMRNGMSPKDACKAALERLAAKHKNFKDFQVGIIALDKNGNSGGYALQGGFTFALAEDGKNEMFEAESLI